MYAVLIIKIFIKVKLNSKEQRIEKIDGAHFIISVKEPPVKGLANRAIIAALAAYLKVTKSKIKIVSGHTSRKKVINLS